MMSGHILLNKFLLLSMAINGMINPLKKEKITIILKDEQVIFILKMIFSFAQKYFELIIFL